MKKFQNKYRIPTNRLSGFDYGLNAFYFVTICTKNREHYFGEIINEHNVEPHHYVAPINNIDPHDLIQTHNFESLQIADIGKIAQNYWLEIPKHYPFVTVDEYVIMPNHIHGILYLNPIDKTEWVTNKFGPQSNNLGAIIRGFKSSVKRYANQNKIEFEWQSRYHDRIIRDDNEYYAIKNYIINNPKNWKEDELY